MLLNECRAVKTYCIGLTASVSYYQIQSTKPKKNITTAIAHGKGEKTKCNRKHINNNSICLKAHKLKIKCLTYNVGTVIQPAYH